MQKVMKTLVMRHVETIEGLQEQIESEYDAIERLGQAVGEHFWSKEAKTVVENRRRARLASDEADAVMGTFDLVYDEETGENRERNSADLMAELAPKLRSYAEELGGENGERIIKELDTLEKLAAATAS